jgi:hypothetical protein
MDSYPGPLFHSTGLISIFVSVPCCFYFCGCVVSLNSGIVILPALLFMLNIALAIHLANSFVFPNEL